MLEDADGWLALSGLALSAVDYGFCVGCDVWWARTLRTTFVHSIIGDAWTIVGWRGLFGH